MKRLNMELNNECRLARYTMRSALNVNYVKAVKEDLKYYASQIRKINNPFEVAKLVSSACRIKRDFREIIANSPKVVYDPDGVAKYYVYSTNEFYRLED